MLQKCLLMVNHYYYGECFRVIDHQPFSALVRSVDLKMILWCLAYRWHQTPLWWLFKLWIHCVLKYLRTFEYCFALSQPVHLDSYRFPCGCYRFGFSGGTRRTWDVHCAYLMLTWASLDRGNRHTLSING